MPYNPQLQHRLPVVPEMVEDERNDNKEPKGQYVGVVFLDEQDGFVPPTAQAKMFSAQPVEKYVPKPNNGRDPRHHAVRAQMLEHPYTLVNKPVYKN